MKRIVVLILAVAMIFAMTACGTSEEQQAPSEDGADTPNETTTDGEATDSDASGEPAGPAGPEVLQDVRVRQALSLAIDRDYINETVFNGTRIPAYGLVPGGIPDAESGSDFREVGGDLMGTNLEENIAKAQELLAEAGFPGGEGFPVLEFSFNTNTGHQAVAEACQQMWKTNLGIDVDIASMEWDVFQGYRKTNDCHLARQGWLGDYTDPSTFFDLLTSDAGTNDGHYNSAEYDQLVKDAKIEPDLATRMDMYHQAEAVLMNDMPMIPVVFYADDVLSQTDLTGYGVTGTGNKMFWEASKADVAICVGSQPETLDPTMNQSVDGFIYLGHMYEGLYRPNVDGTFSLGQAKEFTVEGNTVKVVLRDDIFWSDGEPVTAENFAYSWRRLCDPAVASPYSYLAGDLFVNGWDVIEGTVAPEELCVRVIDDKTLEFDITADVPFLKDLMAFPNFFPLREDVVAQNPEGWATTTDYAVFNGRYTLETLANEDMLVMVKNDKYWDADSTIVNSITCKLMSDDNSMLAAFKNKELDLIDSLPTDELAALQQTEEYHRYGQIGLYYLQINNTATAE